MFLPLELHQLIIDVIGDEYVSSKLPSKDGTRDALQACSLVCKSWHSRSLRHTFYSTDFAFFNGDRVLQRQTELFRILDVNPSIRRCIRRTEIYLETGVLLEDVEALCNTISPIETLRVVVETSHDEPDSPHSPLEGLHPILNTQFLRDFSVWAAHFPLRLVENATKLRSLTLQGVETLDTESVRDGAWCSESTLEKLVVARGRRVLTQVGAAVERSTGLYAFFEGVKHLEMYLTVDELLHHSSWRLLLARWIRLETLVFHWILATIGKLVFIDAFRSAPNSNQHNFLTETSVKLFKMCQMIPWESFQGLHTLTYDVSFRTTQPDQLLGAEVDPSKTIFSGPSRLPRLQHLRIVHSNRRPFSTVSDICTPLNIIYQHNLNRTIEDSNSFPCLQSFHTEVMCTVVRRSDASLGLDGDKLGQLVVDHLPAVFGSGGRRETHGWSTSIVPSVRIVT